MYGYTRLTSVVLLAAFLCCGSSRAQPARPAKYATIKVGAEESIQKVLFSPTGDSLSYLFSGKTIATWDVKTKQQHKQVHKAETVFRDMDYSPDGRMLAVSEINAVFHIDI